MTKLNKQMCILSTVLSLVIYYLTVGVLFISEDFKTKREFHLSLIPFQKVVKGLSDKYHRIGGKK